MNSKLERLTNGFLTAVEIASIVGGDAKNALTKLRNIAKESKMAIEVKTDTNNGVRSFYRLIVGEYNHKMTCVDDVIDSTIEWQELFEKIKPYGNAMFSFAVFMFENKSRYMTYSEISEQIGRSDIDMLVKRMEDFGFFMHRRNTCSNREVKLICIRDKPRKKIKRIVKNYKPVPIKLINEVFR